MIFHFYTFCQNGRYLHSIEFCQMAFYELFLDEKRREGREQMENGAACDSGGYENIQCKITAMSYIGFERSTM